MKIIICGSIRAADAIWDVKAILEAKGHSMEIPEGVKNEGLRNVDASNEERAEVKINHNLIRGYYEKMKEYDAVLVVNPIYNGIGGYIGGNTFLEMGFAHVLNKKLYILYDVPSLSYTSEILAMQPIALHGNIDLL